MRIGKDIVNGFKVSTVKLPCAYAGKHFETMVFIDRVGGDEVACAQYATEEEAIAGHAQAVAKWAAYKHDRPVGLTLAQLETMLGI